MRGRSLLEWLARGLALALFLPWFALQIVAASLEVARLVLDPRRQPKPGWVPYSVSRPSKVLATLLGLFLSLTPGTLAVEYDPERALLEIHTLDTPSVETVTRSVRRIEERILAWFGRVGHTVLGRDA